MKKKNWSLLFVILFMIFIFCFSNQNAKKSQNLSDAVAIKAFDIKANITNQANTEEEREIFIRETRLIIRKSAHFIIYFFLGILCFIALKNYNVSHPIVYTIIICFLYACSDELHQLFVNERTAKFMDVLIDTCGSGVGIVIANLLTKTRFFRHIL